MAVTSKATTKEESRINGYKVGALVTQAVSWVTTYWCVEWIMQPAADGYPIVILVSLIVEGILIMMKRCLFNADRHDDAIGWVGLVIDAFINAGGILPKAGRLLTFPPVAAILLVFGVSAGDKSVNAIGAFIIALIGGALLSVLPHRLWSAGDD